MKNGFARAALLLVDLACLVPACPVTVYYNQAAWQAAMSQQGNDQLMTIGFVSSQWTSAVEYSPAFTGLVSQSTTAASNGMAVSVDSGFSEPGYAATSTLGHVANGVWTDDISKYGSTSFTFGTPIYGFGGDFEISGATGLYISGVGDVGVGTSSGYDGFIGVVTELPMDSIFISWGSGGNSTDYFGNSYTLTNFAVDTSATPEPSFKYAVAGLLVLAAIWCIRRPP
jgi:hypothetical protein